MDAATTATSSRATPFLSPNPPPTSPASTRICSIGTLICDGSSIRYMCGDCVDAWIVRCSAAASQSAIEPAALHRNRLVTVDLDTGAHDVVGLGEDVVDVAERHVAFERDVVGELVVERRLALVERVLVGDDRFEHLDVLVDELERVFRGVAVLGDDQRNRIADVADLVGRETVDGGRLQARHHVHADHRTRLRGLRQPGEIGAGVDGDDARERPRLGRVDRHEPAVRHGAAEERAVQHPRQHDVVDVATASAQDARILGPRHAAAPMERAPTSTAISILLRATIASALSTTVPSRHHDRHAGVDKSPAA